MKPMAKKIKDVSSGLFMPITALLAAFFLCGAVIGNAAAFASAIDSSGALAQLLNGETRNGPILSPSILSSFWGIGKYHLIIWILGFTCFGIFLIPLVVAAKGFLLTFSIAYMYKLSGGAGLLSAAAALGLQNLIALPCMLLVASQAFSVSAALFSFSSGIGKGESAPLFSPKYILLALFVLILLILAAAVETYMAPQLFAWSL